MADQTKNEFERIAGENPGGNIVSDFWHFLRHNKKWWLLPLLIILLVLSALMLLGTSGLAPALYTFF